MTLPADDFERVEAIFTECTALNPAERGGRAFLVEGVRLFTERQTYNFGRFYGALAQYTQSEPAHAGRALP